MVFAFTGECAVKGRKGVEKNEKEDEYTEWANDIKTTKINTQTAYEKETKD